ncbi:protein of unknown function [Cupriavidus neocaledonicus]|uniref:Uncharacterized protein n=1 Tax=Cupriavidus neocaledonicus TaxID=1040979 RepID=A0A375H9P0_9BURK|nr:protein of unknown function [Cupriavidus neocaledonicus]
MAGFARERRVAGQRAPCQCDGATAAAAHPRDPGRAHHVPDAIQCGLRRAAAAGDRGAARKGLALLHLYRRGRLPFHVFVGPAAADRGGAGRRHARRLRRMSGAKFAYSN